MRFERSSGILLHPTSLPGPHGIGDLGPEAVRFVDFLAEAGQRWWQVLPLGPTGYGDSPYQCFSAFAGNPWLISPDALIADGLLTREELPPPPQADADRIDYGPVIEWKRHWLAAAARRLATDAPAALRAEFQAWRAGCAWLEDYACFMALKDLHGGRSWDQWEDSLRRREKAAIAARHDQLREGLQRHAAMQWFFHRQWTALREYAHRRGIRIMGDAPIFVSYDSADVWSRPELFHLDHDARPTVVAGVPPDYFSELGQLWGNPLYRWDVMAQDGFAWWIERVGSLLSQVDAIRLDHFIGFHNYWEVPAGAPDARHGRWRPGPGAALFDAIRSRLGDPPFIAEDLGEASPEVFALRDRFQFPGMKILQFAFGGGPANPFLPHRYTTPNCAAYTGTHDNDPARGWWDGAAAEEQDYARAYLGTDARDFSWDLIRLGMSSIADLFIAQAQDLLALGAESRMNLPGRPSDNWRWRLLPGQLNAATASRLRALAAIYGRTDGRGLAGA